jgi:hypothetical protein
MSFFSFIQQASIEKCHSAALAWIFSGSNSYLSEEEKRGILHNWCKVSVCGKFENVFTEYKNIDILVEYDDLVVAIENKIKISQHDQQLFRYTQVLEGSFPGRKVLKVLLSLSGEVPHEKDWMSLTYDKVLESLKPHAPNSEIIEDYIKNLERLVGARNEFLANHTKFKNVFTDGGKPKHLKSNDGRSPITTVSYISDNGLETLFQKMFFQRIIDAIGFQCIHTIVSETRGNALIDFKNPAGMPLLTIEGEAIDLGIQIQGNTVKAQFEVGLDSNGVRKAKSVAKGQVLVRAIPRIYEEIKLAEKGWRLNRPRNPASDYHSFSKKIVFPSGSKGFSDCPLPASLAAVRDSIEVCMQLFRDASEYTMKSFQD